MKTWLICEICKDLNKKKQNCDMCDILSKRFEIKMILKNGE